uniref:Fibronectin type-III domain-containing protein n=1 Tax=Photinus pyralis TaxID=7054 RepID=A0A1Y1KUY6_PHOPY
MYSYYANIYYKSLHLNWHLVLHTLFFIVKGINSAPPELTFILNKQNASRVVPIWIGEGDVLNSAIAWIYPLVNDEKDLPHIVSNYLPATNNAYNCNFAKSKSCSKKWETGEWKTAEFDVHSFKPIVDTRWENFPTYLTSNLTKDFSVRVDIPSVFEIGISVRAAKNVEVLVCEGWHPERFPCYYVSIGGPDNKQSFLRKYKNGIPTKFSVDDPKLAKYKHEIGVLSEELWKTFSLSLNANGTFKLRECVTNVTILDYSDKSALNPINVIVRSKNQNALWKLHKNEYLFTTKPNIARFGPELHPYGSQLCVALYVSICKYCTLRFFTVQNGKNETLREIVGDNDSDELLWKEIKLIRSNVFDDTLQIYTETYYVDKADHQNGFWAIDDVRVCSENEIRISKLILNDMAFNDFDASHITCEILKNPKWRPVPRVSSPLTDVVCNSSTATSIRMYLNSPSEDTTHQQYSIIQYEGNDICHNTDASNKEQNIQRVKSQGYLIGKGNHIDIPTLVPYTLYNIHFWNIIDDSKRFCQMHTIPTEVPTKEEIPKDIKMTITDTANIIEWNEPKCTVKYGPIVYQVHVKNQNNSNSSILYLETDTRTKYKFDNLQPFTNYTVEIDTARNFKAFQFNTYIATIYNFTTKAGVAPKVNNLELYSINERSASIRFELPPYCKGLPKIVQVRWCHPLFLSGCLSDLQNLTKCKLWDSKYCIEINNLVKGGEYVFNVSIKNQDTFIFSEEASINGKAVQRVPGKPSGLIYNTIKGKNYGSPCNLNISWEHPYDQNGTITLFEVFLEETSYNFAADTSKTIHEILKVDKQSYQKRYSCVINYVSYDTPYKISVRAVNDDYKGEFESVQIKTESEETYSDPTPEFVSCTNETITFKLPKLEAGLNSSMLIVIVQDYNNSKTHILDDIDKLEMFGEKYKLCNEFGESWVAKNLLLSSGEPPLMVVGDRSVSYVPQLQKNVTNKPLKPDTEYCFTFAFVDQEENIDRFDVYHYKHLYTQRNSMAEAQDDVAGESNNVAIYVVPMLCIILLVGCGVWFLRRFFIKKRTEEHIYESMPFDDYIPDAVSNESYDTLVHN